MGNDHPGPNKKSGGVFISNALIRNIAFGILGIILIALTITYFNSGLTLKKAKEVFLDKWISDKQKVTDLKINGIKKLKKDTYWVKVNYIFRDSDETGYYLEKNGNRHSLNVYFLPEEDRAGYIKKKGLKNEFRFSETQIQEDLLYTKWDTGWFIEVKRK
jgi:hypothetical protein